MTMPGLNFPFTSHILEKGFSALRVVSSHAALYPFESLLFMGVADLKERAERIREIVEDFGAANFWASPAACGKGYLVRSKETLELAERWAQEGNYDYLPLV